MPGRVGVGAGKVVKGKLIHGCSTEMQRLRHIFKEPFWRNAPAHFSAAIQ